MAVCHCRTTIAYEVFVDWSKKVQDPMRIRESLVGVNEVASYLGVSVSWVNKAVAARTLPVIRVGRNLRFRLSDIERHLNGLPE